METNHEVLRHLEGCPACRADDAMGKDSMAPASIGLSASGVDLGRHVGHKVTVTGTDGDAMNGMATFTVTSLKMTGKTCG